MSRYKGLFTYDIDNHRYVTVEQADGIISDMNYKPKEEPKEYFYIDADGEVIKEPSDDGCVFDNNCREIGNYFKTEEDAEKAVEKAKAIVRLNKCGFRFEGYNNRDRANGGDIVIYAHVDTPNNNLIEEAQPAMLKDLDLLFGGEE